MTQRAHAIESVTTFRINRVLPRLLQGIAWPFGFLILKYFGHLKVKGKHNLHTAVRMRHDGATPRGVIFAINHASELDPIILLSGIMPFSTLTPMFYVSADRQFYAKKSSFRSNILYRDWFFNAWGAYALKRGTGSYAESLHTHECILRKGNCLAIFPEGRVRRSPDDETEAHGGGVYLAEQTNAVVIPVRIHHSQPHKERNFWGRANHITITYGAPLEYSDFLPDHNNHERYKEGAEILLKHIYEQTS